MRFLTYGMRRSGTNLISNWLLRQSSLNNNEINTSLDWVSTDNNNKYRFLSQINHPEHSDFKEYMNVDNIVMSIEGESFIEVDRFCIYHDIDLFRIMYIRDFKNWLASLCKMQGNINIPERDIVKYVNCLEQAIDNNVYFISYNKFVFDINYRKEICKSLQLKFTDSGINTVLSNGGGSSFDGLAFDGEASKMKVLERWKEYENNLGFQMMLNRYSNIVEKSDRFFRG